MCITSLALSAAKRSYLTYQVVTFCFKMFLVLQCRLKATDNESAVLT
jgi:hypothetical protein